MGGPSRPISTRILSSNLDEMKTVSAHDVVHTVLTELGDISSEPPSIDRIKSANKAALGALRSQLEQLAS